MKKLSAFTLAETLIVIGIIGVVSALTLPNLNSSTGEKEKVAKVKKIYQNLDDAVGRAVAVYGPIDEWFVSDNTEVAQTTKFGNRITEFMKVSKNCAMTANSGCMTNSTAKTLNGQTSGALYDDSTGDRYRVILADGTSVSFSCFRDSCIIFFDIDGPNKGPHVVGKDCFLLTAISDGIMPPKSPNSFDLLVTGWGAEVTSWVINYENMDYLKASVLNGKCNSGNVTLNPAANPPVVTCK